jgi:general secretion pathway protein D
MHPLLRWIADRPHARTLAALAAGALAAPAALAQVPPPPAAGDLLDQTRKLQQVATQQTEAEVRLALADAARLAVGDRARAVEKYKQVLQRLERDQTLTPDRRTTLVRVVQDRIRVTEAEAVAAAESDATRRAKEEAAQRGDADKQAAERAKIKATIAAIAGLRGEGKVAEAQRQAKELLKDHPDDLTVQVLNGVSTAADAVAENDALRKEKEQRRVVAIRDLERSATMPNGDIEFPKDWKEKTERRRKATGLSEDEVRVLQALARPLNAEFRNSKLQDVIDYISTMSGRPIVLDKIALEENQLTYDTPITFAVKTPIATRTVLRAVLNQVGLTYVVRDNVIQVTTQSRAREMMVTKSYYVGDLVTATGRFGGAPQWGFAMDHAQLAENVGGIVEMITASIDPTSWQGKGGLGTIGFNIPTMSLIIRQSSEVHAMIRGGLYK